MTARELSFVLWTLAGLTAAFFYGPTRTALLGAGRALRQPAHIVILGLYVMGMALLAFLAAHLGWWSLNLIVPTSIWIVVSGFRVSFSATDVGKDPFWLRKRSLEIVGMSAIATLLIDAGELPVWAELLFLPLLTILVLLQLVAGRNLEQESVSSCLGWIVGMASVSLLFWGTVSMVNQIRTVGLAQMWQSLVLPIWLGSATVVFAMVLAVFLEYDVTFRLAKFGNQDARIPFLSRLAFVTCLGVRVRYIHAFRFPYLRDLATSSTWNEGFNVANSHRERVRLVRREIREERRIKRRYKGTDAKDFDGRRLDNREFAETREALQNLHRWEQQSRERHGRYTLDVLQFMTSWDVKGLPEPHEIELRINKKGRAYVAFRTTISGWTLGIGALRDSEDLWLYDSRMPPASSVPGDRGWTKMREHVPPNWLDEFGEDF